MQAVTTGAYRAVEYIKKHINLEVALKWASVEDSKEVVKICTQYAQAGMVNIFGVIFCFTLAFACFDPTFFASYLISIAVFGLFQAMFMANAGGAWDNAKKVVEVDLREKGTPLHAATVVGDTVGDPFKDTSSVALNPIIKFTTLFGLLAVRNRGPALAGRGALRIPAAYSSSGISFLRPSLVLRNANSKVTKPIRCWPHIAAGTPQSGGLPGILDLSSEKLAISSNDWCRLVPSF